MNRLLLLWITAMFLTEQVSAQLITNIASFNGANGAQPIAPLIQANDGNFYGTTTNGGTSGFGTVFRMTPAGTLTALISFNSNNGAYPMAGVVQGTNGDLFGTTRDGGTGGLGTVFKVTLGGALTTLYSFQGSDGAHPYGGLVQGNDGNFYGTTFDGGSVHLGTVFQITADGTLTSLAEFGQTNGANPTASLVQANDGTFYGTTSSGGDFTTNGITYFYGTLFQYSSNTITTLNSFGPDNGALPYAGVLHGSDGNFYGTTIGPANGTAFRMQSDGTVTATALNDGDQPFGSLIQARDGNFYGTTRQTIFRMTPSGTVTTVANINGSSCAGLLQAADGNFYGTTTFGGIQNTGSVFRIVPAPQFATQPATQTVYSNANVVLSANVTGIAPLSYQWFKNGLSIPGATGSSFSVTGAQQSDSGTYTLLVTNGFGSSNSVAAALTVLPLTTVLFQSTTHNSDGTLGAAWMADIGTSYDLQFKSSLTNAQWTTISSSTATSNTLALNITPGAATQGFYRIASYYNVSDPIGFVQLNLPGNSDSYVSVPFLRPAAATASVSSIASNIMTAAQQYPSTWTVNQFLYAAGAQSNTYYLRFTSGADEGRIFTVTGNSANSVTVNLNGASLNATTGDTFVIEPDWTLNSVFPNGAGVNVSPTAGNRNTEILIPDVTTPGINLSAARIYYFNAGIWKQTGQGSANHGEDVLQLNVPFIVRHNVSTNTTLVCAGAVPIHRWNISLRTADGTAGDQQDSYFGIARPIPVSLDDSGLISSGAFAASPRPGSRTDELFTFDNTALAKNKSSSAIYFYWSNAWRRVGAGTGVFGSTQVFAPGTGVIIRKGTNILAPTWTNTPTY